VTEFTRAQALTRVNARQLLVIVGCTRPITRFVLAATQLSGTGLVVGTAGSIVVAVTLRRRSVR